MWATESLRCPYESQSLHSVTQKKSCLSQKGDLSSVVVGDSKQPYVGRFSYHIRIVEFLALKFHYFCIIVSIVVILMKNLEIYIINRYYREETQKFFRKFPFIFTSRKLSFWWKNVILTFFNLGNQRLVIR